ncbi:hypothetical protein [uncultured Olsenella sp.]|uniref:hypothetical protein n=1 Tax=uncultured Olsenella sp. TaxID=190764 RepID=UPI0026DB6B31|nr:hypothetical protein [uncultured Olsenella sp.]
MNKMMNLAKSHWKQMLAVLAVVVALLLLLVFAQCNASNDASAGTQITESAVETSSSEQPVVPEDESGTAASVSSMTPEDSSDPQTDESDSGAVSTTDSELNTSEAPAASTTSSVAAAAPSSESSSPAASSSESVPTHEMRWVDGTEQVWVVDSEAWGEQVPIYDSQELSICNICGADITGRTAEHGKAHMLAGEWSGHHSEVHQILVGYDEIEHAEQGHYETVVTGGHWE